MKKCLKTAGPQGGIFDSYILEIIPNYFLEAFG